MQRITIILTAVLMFFSIGADAQRVTDSGYRTVAHIKSDGTIQDADYRTIGHAPGISKAWAAYLFFFL